MIQLYKQSTASHLYEVLEEIHPTNYFTFINTGVLGTSDISVEVKYKCPSSFSNDYPRIFGTYSYYNWQSSMCANYEGYPKKLQFALIGSTNGWDYISNIDPDSNEHIIYLSSSEARYDNQVLYTTTPTQYYGTDNYMQISIGDNIYNESGTQGYYNIYYFKIWDNGTLIRDMVPVKRLSDNKYGMYDYVNDQFYSSSGDNEYTGTSKSTPEYIDAVGYGTVYVNNVVLCDHVVDHVYELLDYVITPSQSSINTEVLVDGSVVVEMIANIASGGGTGPRLFSSNDTNSDWPGWYEPGTWGLQKEGNYLAIALFGSIYDGSQSSAVMNTNITWSSLINKKLRYNLTAAGILNVYNDDDTLFGYYDVTAYSDPTYVSSTPIKLFIRYAGHEYIPQNSKIYDVKIWKNNDLIKHYVPAKRLSDSVYGFYDLVDGAFHPNEVSGYSFTGVAKSVPEYIDKEMVNPIYINRIYLDGDIYWGNDIAPTPPTPPTPTHLIHGTTTATSSFNIGINKGSFSAAANVPVIVENGEFWLDELPSEYSTVTSLTGCFVNCSQITSIDMFNIDTSNLVNNDSCVRTWLGAGNQVTSIGKLNIDFSNIDYLWDACSWLGGITEADLSGWIVSTNTIHINGLFAGCTNLQHINLSNWQLPSSCRYSDPFYGVYNLIDITMNNVSQGTFDVITNGLKQAGKTSVKVYRDGVTYVYNGSTWVVE